MQPEVMTRQDSQFQTLFSDSVALVDSSDLLKKARTKAWDHFLSLGMPNAKTEAYQYMRLKPLLFQNFVKAQNVSLKKEEIAQAILPECKNSHLVFINGYFHPELSDTSGLEKAIVISPLNQAMRTYGTLIHNRWSKALKEESDIFCALNSACYQDGLFLYVPPKLKVSLPVQILHVIAEDNAWMMPRVYIFQGAHSELTLASTTLWKASEKYFYNQTTEFTLEEGANTTLIQNALSDALPTNGWICDDLRVEMKRSSCFKTFQLTDGTAIVRCDSKVQIAGEGADLHLNGMWLLDGEKEAHTNIVIDHQEPHTQSLQLFKGVLTGASRSSFQGKILVRKKAQKTQAYQLNNNLLLSEKAQAYSKPNLEIFADDVKATHGATFGQLDPEEMFYLKSRGFSEQDAKNALISGFCQDVVEQLALDSIKEQAQTRLLQYVSS